MKFISHRSGAHGLVKIHRSSEFNGRVYILSRSLGKALRPGVLCSMRLGPVRGTGKCMIITTAPILFRTRIRAIVIPGALCRMAIAFNGGGVFFSPGSNGDMVDHAVSNILRVLGKHGSVGCGRNIVASCLGRTHTLMQHVRSSKFVCAKSERRKKVR